MLPQQRAWRKFARLHHRHRVPDVRILNAFRLRLGVTELRQINETILQPFLPSGCAVQSRPGHLASSPILAGRSRGN